MSEFSSFYGGRQGASFVIIKRFDGIDIPDETKFRVGCYATDEAGLFYTPLVEKTGENTDDYEGWGLIVKDGESVYDAHGGGIVGPLDLEYAEGMIQCFEKGAATTSEVGYGEYVIIDTIAGLQQYHNVDNGKIYRRGMDYSSELGGAEYVAQITGMKGDTPELGMDTIEEVEDYDEYQIREYTPDNGGIVPGLEKNGGLIQYNDNITYGWATVRDNFGDIKGALIGFTFPYLVPELATEFRSAYYTAEDYMAGRIPSGKTVGDKLADDFSLFLDNGFNTPDRDPGHGDTGHPFYRKWKVAIPAGVNGSQASNFEIVPKKVREGASLWTSSDVTQTPATTADANTEVINIVSGSGIDFVYPYSNTSVVVQARKNNVTYYAKIEDTYMLVLRYKYTDYSNKVDGESVITEIGDYNTLRNMWLDSTGKLHVRYNADEDRVISEEDILWITDADISSDGTLTFTYNNGTSWSEQVFPWIVNATMSDDGTLSITYNNELNASQYPSLEWDSSTHTWAKQLATWITNANLDSEGKISFTYNNEKLVPNPRTAEWGASGSTWSKMIVPWINNVDFLPTTGTVKLTFNNTLVRDALLAEGWTWPEGSLVATKIALDPWIDKIQVNEDGTFTITYNRAPVTSPFDNTWTADPNGRTWSKSCDFTKPSSASILDSSTVDSETNKTVPATEKYRNSIKEDGIWFVKSTINAAY